MSSQVFESILTSIIAIIRKVPTLGGWRTVRVPHVGDVAVHRVDTTLDVFKGVNEVWVRFERYEYRGSVETVAKEIARHRRAPSKAVGKTAAIIESRWFSSNPAHSFGFSNLKEPEIAAWLGLDEELTFKAMSYIEMRGYARQNEIGEWVRVAGV